MAATSEVLESEDLLLHLMACADMATQARLVCRSWCAAWNSTRASRSSVPVAGVQGTVMCEADGQPEHVFPLNDGYLAVSIGNHSRLLVYDSELQLVATIFDREGEGIPDNEFNNAYVVHRGRLYAAGRYGSSCDCMLRRYEYPLLSEVGVVADYEHVPLIPKDRDHGQIMSMLCARHYVYVVRQGVDAYDEGVDLPPGRIDAYDGTSLAHCFKFGPEQVEEGCASFQGCAASADELFFVYAWGPVQTFSPTGAPLRKLHLGTPPGFQSLLTPADEIQHMTYYEQKLYLISRNIVFVLVPGDVMQSFEVVRRPRPAGERGEHLYAITVFRGRLVLAIGSEKADDEPILPENEEDFESADAFWEARWRYFDWSDSRPIEERLVVRTL